MSAGEAAPAAAAAAAPRPALLVHGALWGLPSACPCCIRAEAYLCLAAFPHDCVECPAQITSCDLPALEDYPSAPTHPPAAPDHPSSSSASAPDSSAGAPSSPPPADPADSRTPASADTAASADTPPAGSSAAPRARRASPRPVIALSSASASAVEDYLRAHRGVDLDAALSPVERAELTALRGLVETTLSSAAQAELWGEERNRAALREMFDAAVPWPLSRALLWREARNQGWGEAERKAQQGEGGGDGRSSGPGAALARAGVRSREELFARAAAAYSALASRLGDAPLFFDPRPTSLDAALYAHLIFVTQAPLAQSQLQQLVLSHAPLRAFLSAMTNRLTAARAALQDGSAVPPPLSRPFAPSRGAAGRKESRSAQSSTESSKPRSTAWLFVLAQVAAILGYIVVSSVSLELGEDEEEEEVEEAERSGRRHGVPGSERGGLRGQGDEKEDGGAEGEDGEEDGDMDDDDDDE